MKKLCRRAIEFVQVMNDSGEVRVCGWLKDGGVIGRLTEKSMKEIYNSPEAQMIKDKHANCDYSNCNPNACPYVANNTVDENSIEIEEFPEYPPALYLAYENVCNYRCVMCTIPDCMAGVNQKEHEEKLDKIDAEVIKILPYVKKLSANGLGELFASRHIMKVLSEWKPLAPAEECSVVLETNGSLFNEKNWEKISNLGKYHLSVCVTVLSFDDELYRELSGTILPISNLIDNLHFIRKLKEEGIVNYFEIATVYQQKNYRELPSFARRCLEEFDADYVRLRPFEPWKDPDMQDWFKDVRNEYHPEHEEFLEVMKDPIFKHPKVHDWGGGNLSGLGPEPYPRLRKRYSFIEKILCDDCFEAKVKERITTRKLVIYGMHIVGKALASFLKDKYEIIYCIDRGMDGKCFEGLDIHGVNNLEGLDRETAVIVTLDQNEEAVISLLKREGYQDVVSIKELVGE